MIRLYVTPREVVPGNGGVVYVGPLYFAWGSPGGSGSGTLPRIAHIDYGFTNAFLVAANLTQGQIDSLLTHADAYAFPEAIDDAIAPQDGIRTAFEQFMVPTDWLSAATTYREFIRRINGIFAVAKRYAVIAAEGGSPTMTNLFSSITLETRYNQFPAQVKTFFDATLVSLGFDPSSIQPNMTVRQMLKFTSDTLQQPFTFAGVTW